MGNCGPSSHHSLPSFVAPLAGQSKEFRQRIMANSFSPLGPDGLEGGRAKDDNTKKKKDAANSEDDTALSLEETAKQALHCPCVADLVNGHCGKEFKSAFACFIKSEKPEKGSDCILPFQEMQKCMIVHADEFTSANDSQTEEKYDDVEDAHNLPKIPAKAIRLPLYLMKEMETEESK